MTSPLDALITQLGTTDTRKKIQLGNDTIALINSSEKLDCEDVGQFIDSLAPWLHSSNFKVVLNGLDIMYLLIQKLGEDFRPYINSVIPPTIDRLGDSKDSVREKAQLLLSTLMISVITPNIFLERVSPSFAHKNAKVREELMHCLQNTLNTHGAPAITISRVIPHVVRLLSDPSAPVRDCAFNTILEAYKHYGERLRQDLQKKFNIPPAKLAPLMTRCDDIRDTGLLLPSAATGTASDFVKAEDDTDRLSVKSGGSKSRASSAPPVRRSVMGASAPSKASAGLSGDSADGGGGRGAAVRRVPSLSKRRHPSLQGTAAGAVDEASFFASFEDVPKLNLYSTKELEDVLNKIRECISDTHNDWDKRVEALKKIRSVMVCGGASFEEFYPHIRLLEPAMQISIKDLRSQVVREACITVAYMSQELHERVDRFCESMLPALASLIPSTAKVMSSAGIVAIRFIIQNTHHHKLVPILAREMGSKSREIRKVICEFMDQLVHTWPAHSMERHVPVLVEAIKKGITDADPEARAFSRKAYWGFADHFRDEADKLLNSLDPSYKKMLHGEANVSSAAAAATHHEAGGGSHHSATAASGAGTAATSSRAVVGSTPSQRPPWSRTSSRAGSTENLSGVGGGGRRSGIPTPHLRPPPCSSSPGGGSVGGGASPFRSTSAIDLQAVRRSQARAAYAHQQRIKAGSGAASLQDKARPRKTPDHPPISSITSPDRLARSRNRGTVSQSQPGSRSGSPSSRLSYATYTPGGAAGEGGTLGRTRRKSGIPRSTGTSREPSPNRYTGFGGVSPLSSVPSKSRSRSISGSCDMPPQLPPGGGVGGGRPRQQMMAHKILQQSREAENALADALVSLPPNVLRSPNRKSCYSVGSRSFDEQSEDNDSETSSVCSERSFDSYSRKSDSFWYGTQQRILRETWDNQSKHPPDVNEIINFCASTHWADRKEGLVGLHAFLRGSHVLTGSELRRITELFTKMFMDTHTKVFSLFLDTLMEVILVHSADLGDWLYILLTRLLNKLGSDLLGSVQAKIHRTLDLVRDSFKVDLQLQVLLRFLTDATQTPNTKVKVATLTYLKCLVDVMECGADLFPGGRFAPTTTAADAPAALAKILAWTADHKSVETRRASSAAFIALFTCNMADLTNVLQGLPPACQAAASHLIQSHLKRAASLDASPSSLPPRTPPSAGGTPPPVLQSPNTVLPRGHHHTHGRLGSRFHGLVDLDDTENLNPEEISKSLKRTTDEIRNYSFDLEMSSSDRRDSLEKHRDSTSQDSGISQLSAGGGDLKGVEPCPDSLLSSSTLFLKEESNGVLSGRSSSVSSPTHRNLLLSSTETAKNGIDVLLNDDEFAKDSAHESDAELMGSVIAALSSTTPNNSSSTSSPVSVPGSPAGVGVGGSLSEPRAAEKRAALTTLIRLARTGSTVVWNENFRGVLRLLVENLVSEESSIRVLVLAVLTEMMRRCPLVQHFLRFSELIILRVLKAHADIVKDVVRGAQVCSGTVAEILPPDIVIRILKPLIQMHDYPTNQAAIKMLNRLVEAHPPPIVASILPEVMPGLLKAYDNKESCVRKASVFCMVSLHNSVGASSMQPFLHSLTGSKLKLLNLYIKRAEAQSSGASSPKSEPQV